jgi:hypothetical protein
MASPNLHQAAHAVFNTNELLCGIIARLPFKDIVVTTGVCKTWRKALKDNVAIQQALFLTPMDVVDIISEVRCLSMRLELIPLHQYSIVGETHSQLPDLEYTSTKEDVLEKLSSRQLFKHPLGCWRDLFVTQPPATTVGVSVFPALHGDSSFMIQSEKMEFNCETGVKMGELHDFCQSMLRSNPQATSINTSPEGFMSPERNPHSLGGGRWDVRDGKVCRQTQLRLAELPDSVTSSDESDSSDDDRDDDYDTDEIEEERYEARCAWLENTYEGEYDDGDNEWDYDDDDD